MKGAAMRTSMIRRVLDEAAKLPGLVVSQNEADTLADGSTVQTWTLRNERGVDTGPLTVTLTRPVNTRGRDRIEYTLTSRGEEVDLRTDEDFRRLLALWRLRGVEGAELVDTLTLPGWKQLALFPLEEGLEEEA